MMRWLYGWKRLNVAGSRPFAIVRTVKGSKCASSEENQSILMTISSIGKRSTAKSLRASCDATCVRNRCVRRNVRTARNARRNARDRAERLVIDQEASYIPKKRATLRSLHFVCPSTRFHRFRVFYSLPRIFYSLPFPNISASLLYILFFFYILLGQSYDTPRFESRALGRHIFARIGRIRNYSTTVACGTSNWRRFDRDCDAHCSAPSGCRWQNFSRVSLAYKPREQLLREIHVFTSSARIRTTTRAVYSPSTRLSRCHPI